MGLVLNRPSDVTIADAVPKLAPLVEEHARLHMGGPVQQEAVVVLAELDDPEQAALLALADIGFLKADADPDELAGTLRRARVYVGYSGWGALQLEAELEESAWIVEPALPDDVFAPPTSDLWSAVLRRMGGTYAMIATMPPDPSLNRPGALDPDSPGVVDNEAVRVSAKVDYAIRAAAELAVLEGAGPVKGDQICTGPGNSPEVPGEHPARASSRGARPESARRAGWLLAREAC